jgi:phenylalanine-4-hydroxylase
MSDLKLPSYLRPYVATQRMDLYTPMDHAAWRFILRLSQKFFAKHAHASYLRGLEQTGISTDRIPTITEMDEKLQRFGWRAIPICGFIPPAAFMEFLSLGILPIACDMRKLENLSYTPAPDIVHEAAGHAPIIEDPGYADYLHAYGEISQKAIFSSEDMNLYLAIRRLSDIKEDPASTSAQIADAQAHLDETARGVTYVSEAMQLARMSWWTIEYGLVGSLAEPKLYGAGLLSSLSESFHALDPEVQKVPLTVDCIETSYDITKPQPQLFVAQDFASMKRILRELEARMAFRLGGVEGLARAKRAQTVNTVEFENGIQVSGKLVDWIEAPPG